MFEIHNGNTEGPHVETIIRMILITAGVASVAISGCSGLSSARTGPRALGTAPAAAPQPTFAGMVTNAFKNTTSSLNEALTIKPKVTKPIDPLDLDAPVGNLTHDVYLTAARIHEKNGNLGAAEQQYRKALNAEPGDLVTLLHMGRLYDRQERYTEAISAYKQAVEHNPKSGQAQNDLGLCYARNEKFELAVRHIQSAIQLSPENRLYANNLAIVYVEQDQPDKALEILQSASGEAVANYNVGVLLYKREKFAQAEPYLKKAVTVDDSLTQAANLLAQIGDIQVESQIVQAQNIQESQNRIADARGGYDDAIRQPEPFRFLAADDAPSAPSPAGNSPTELLRKLPAVE